MGLGRKPDPREQYKSVHTPGFCPPPRNCGCCCSGLISTSRRQKAEGRKPGPMSQSRLSAQPHFGDALASTASGKRIRPVPTSQASTRATNGTNVVRVRHILKVPVTALSSKPSLNDSGSSYSAQHGHDEMFRSGYMPVNSMSAAHAAAVEIGKEAEARPRRPDRCPSPQARRP